MMIWLCSLFILTCSSFAKAENQKKDCCFQRNPALHQMQEQSLDWNVRMAFPSISAENALLKRVVKLIQADSSREKHNICFSMEGASFQNVQSSHLIRLSWVYSFTVYQYRSKAWVCQRELPTQQLKELVSVFYCHCSVEKYHKVLNIQKAYLQAIKT